MKKKKQKPTKVHLMSEKGPYSYCGRYLGSYPGMQQTFNETNVTCQRCKEQLSFHIPPHYSLVGASWER